LPVSAVFMEVSIGDDRILCDISVVYKVVASKKLIAKVNHCCVSLLQVDRMEAKFCAANSSTV
jgi:hypothetical protein